MAIEDEARDALAAITRTAEQALKDIGRAADSMAKIVIPSAQAQVRAGRPTGAATQRPVPQNRDEAVRWRDEAQRRGDVEAAKHYSDMLASAYREAITQTFNFAQKMGLVSIKFSQGMDPFMDALDAFSGALDAGTEASKGFSGALGKWSAGTQKAIEGWASQIGKEIGGTTAFFTKEVVEQYKSLATAFRDISNKGMIVGDGLLDLADIASEAGFGNVKQFAKALDVANAHLEKLGMSGDSAAKTIARTFKDLRANNGELGQQLEALGYNIYEQSELIAMASAQNRAAGLANTNLTKDTMELGKSMKLVSELTGKNAKQLVEDARKASLLGRVVASLGPEQLASYRGAMTGSMKIFSDAITESVSPFKSVVTPELRFIVDSVPGFRDALNEITNMIESGVKPEEVNARRLVLENQLQKNVQEFQRTNQFLAASNMVGSITGPARTIADSLDSAGAVITGATEKETREAQARIDKRMRREDELLSLYTETTESALKMQNEINTMMIKPLQGVATVIEGFTSTLATAAKAIEKTFLLPLEKIGSGREIRPGPNSRTLRDLEIEQRRRNDKEMEEINREMEQRQRNKTSPIQPTDVVPTGAAAGTSTMLANATWQQDIKLLMQQQVSLLTQALGQAKQTTGAVEDMNPNRLQVLG